MRRFLVETALAVGLMAICFAPSPSAWAQDDEGACEGACYEAEEACLQACDDSDDPAACEETCQVQTDACMERCE